MSASRYEIEASLRATIFGEIQLCRDRVTLEPVVIKCVDLYLALRQTSRSQELVQENVQLEVEVMNRVRTLGGHPNVINMHSYFVANGVLHMVLDYCEGGDLLDACVQSSATAKEVEYKSCKKDENEDVENHSGSFLNDVDGNKRMKESVAHKYLVDVLSGLRFLHSNGIAHRDDSLLSSTSSLHRLTAREFLCEEMVGKNYYMAPEVVAHEHYDPKCADIWSTGIAFFILLTSSPPFERADPSDPGFRYVAKRGIKAMFTAWGLDQDVSEQMQDLLGRMLCVDPEKRITMDEIWQHPVLQRLKDKSLVGRSERLD
ncbi:unnamed protein product [Peronospora belbahrii]|uniref:Protein kinase domain-containing protein n=1 Tax=Peronospora belbahrii TaxID=622444 RepID=A0AAU9KYH7_9STRA|nr:unnamed protein product [Peronospora belbahrii]